MLFYFNYRKIILGMFDCCQNCLHNSMFIPKVIVAFFCHPATLLLTSRTSEAPPLRRMTSHPLDPSKAHVGAPASAYSAVFNHFSAFFYLYIIKIEMQIYTTETLK